MLSVFLFFSASRVYDGSLSRIYIGLNENIDVRNSVFSNLSSDYGGAIYCLDKVSQISVIQTQFYACFSQSYGGAIYIKSDNAALNLRFVCGSFCYSNGYAGQFAYVSLGTLKEFVSNYVSLSRSSPFLQVGNSPFRILNCYVTIFNNNISRNIVTYTSSIGIEVATKANFCYSTIIDNKADSRVCSILAGGIFNISYLNIINNTHSATTRGVIENWNGAKSSLTMCIFSINSSPLFYIESGSITLKNCCMDSFTYTLTKPTCISTTIGQTKTFYIEMINCNIITKMIAIPKLSLFILIFPFSIAVIY